MGEIEKRRRHGVKDIITKRVGILAVVGMFYSMCCAGAYGVEEMIPDLGPGLTLVLLMVLPFVWALPYSFICAELGSARPVEGGSMIWVKEALGEFWFGIMVIVNFIWALVANTVYSVLAVSYLGNVIDLNDYQAYALKVGIILIFFIINVLGIKEVGFVNTLLSVLVFIAFLLVAVVGFSNMQSNPFVPFMSDEYDGSIFMTVGAGLGLGLWMYSGFDEISVVAGEIKEAKRVIPRALMIVIPLMMLTYILPTMAGVGSIGDWQDWTTDPEGVGYHTVLAEYMPPAFSIFFIVVAVMGQCTIFNICVAIAGRCGLILADENFGPKSLAKLGTKRGTPYVSLIIVAIVTIALLGTPNNQLEFTFLVLVDVFFTVIVCTLTVISAYILKRSIPDEEVPFKTPGGKKGHNLSIGLVLFFCLALILTNGTDYFLGGYMIMLLIPILYVIGKWVWGGAAKNEPEKYPVNPKTKLGFGDLRKIGGYFAGFGVFGLAVRLFLQFYDGFWALGYPINPADFTDYEVRVVAESPELVGPAGQVLDEGEYELGDVWIPGYYEQEYGSGLFSSLDSMLQVITYMGIASFVIGILVLLVGRKIDRKQSAA